VLAKQGIEHVHLVEASREVGGHFRWVPRLPGLAEWIRVVDYRKTVAQKLRNLAVVTNKRLSLDDILDYGADRVILATGSYWARDGLNFASQAPIPGADASLEHVYTPEQIMVKAQPVQGNRVLVYDCEGYFMGVSLAERLALEGKLVSFVTPLASPGPYMSNTEESQRMIPRLYDLGVEICAGHVIEAIGPEWARGHLREYPARETTWEADAVVLVTQRVPDTRLYRALKKGSARLSRVGIRAVYRVGDCVAPRPQVADAIFDAHRLAREIDSNDPATPLPWIRESRALGASDEDFDRIVGDAVPIRPRSVVESLAGPAGAGAMAEDAAAN
jgi:dimethylamine/trimethylamine dehydrogenase